MIIEFSYGAALVLSTAADKLGGAWGGTNCQVVSEDGKKVRRVHPLPEVDLEEVQVNAQSFKKA
jgi:truncated hemoglobin YjbI